MGPLVILLIGTVSGLISPLDGVVLCALFAALVAGTLTLAVRWRPEPLAWAPRSGVTARLQWFGTPNPLALALPVGIVAMIFGLWFRVIGIFAGRHRYDEAGFAVLFAVLLAGVVLSTVVVIRLVRAQRRWFRRWYPDEDLVYTTRDGLYALGFEVPWREVTAIRIERVRTGKFAETFLFVERRATSERPERAWLSRLTVSRADALATLLAAWGAAPR